MSKSIYRDFTGRPTAKYVKNEKELVKFLSTEYTKISKYLEKELLVNPNSPKNIRQIQIMKQVNVMIKQMDKPLHDKIDKYIKEAYLDGKAYQMLSIGDAETMAEARNAQSWDVVNKGRVKALVEDTYKDILLATENTERHIKKVVRDTVKDVAQLNALNNNNYTEQAKQLRKELSKQGLSEKIQKEGFVGVVDKRGRKWDLKVYSQMVIKTKNNDAFKEGVMQQAIEDGMDLAVISDHSAEDACSKWEGVIISLRGETKGYPTYAEARGSNQIFHPNCEHTIHVIRSEDELHPDDIAEAKKKAKELEYKKQPKTRKKPVKPVEPVEPVKDTPKVLVPPVVEQPRESLYELVRNTDSEVFKKIGDTNYSGLHKLLEKAPALHRGAWGKLEKDLKVVNAHSNKHPVCWHTNGIEMNVDKDSKGSHWSNPYQTTFHEFGHNMDYIANVKWGNGSRSTPISYTYKDNLFGNTIQREFNDRIDALDKKMKADFKVNKSDPDWLYENGYISEMNKIFFTEHPDKLKIVKYRKAYAYSALQKEINLMPLNVRADLSDIVEGASGGKVSCGFGHGKAYWKATPTRLGAEAFAEMFDSGSSNHKQLDAIKKYFPEAYTVFEEILEVIIKS